MGGKEDSSQSGLWSTGVDVLHTYRRGAAFRLPDPQLNQLYRPQCNTVQINAMGVEEQPNQSIGLDLRAIWRSTDAYTSRSFRNAAKLHFRLDFRSWLLGP
jgi:hypothetical protein